MPGISRNEHIDNKNKDQPDRKRNDAVSNRLSIPEISLPKGGGAIRSIDEKLTVNAASGTLDLSIPLPFTAGRNGTTPVLSLRYDSGQGNGPFGLGWNIDLPAISRKTDKGLPQYKDEEASDLFLISGAEDLVPLLEETGGTWTKYKRQQTENGIYHTITRYRPRIDGNFMRIEKWKNDTTGETHWRTISGDNISSYFGLTAASRITDPADPLKVFSWLLCQTHNDKGEITVYHYKTEDLENIPATINEKNRPGNCTQVYLKEVAYCNRTPFYAGDIVPADEDFLFRVVLDYGEHDKMETMSSDVQVEKKPWYCRKDPFSNCRAGFEVRTYRRCDRILLFHCFDAPADLPLNPCLVRSLDLIYDDVENEDPTANGFSFLVKARQNSHRWDVPANCYVTKSLPDLEFSYGQPEWNQEVKNVSPEDILHAPIGIDDRQYLWFDLFSEGISGILTEQANCWYYKSNLGNGNFSSAKLISPKPSFRGLQEGLIQIGELEGNGVNYLYQYGNDDPGSFKLDSEEEWQRFKNFDDLPADGLTNKHKKFIDLDGDGINDLLVTGEQSLQWFHNNGEKGFRIAGNIAKELDEEKGPSILFSTNDQTLFLADMNGDGLTDIVRIRNGEICYWPNKGYGRFGAKCTMSDAPLFDHPDAFNASLLRLADVDGSGMTDIIYLGKNEVRIWTNRNGNSWSPAPRVIDNFPGLDDHSTISLFDLLGTGTGCLVYSSPLPAHLQQPMRYIDLLGSKKPYLLTGYKNNCGKEVRFEYRSSTQFYLDDKKNGQPWVTKLAFPVHVLVKKEMQDTISQLRFTSSYTYHHGHYDTAEREFRGFGRVDQLDTEIYEHFKRQDASNIVEEDLHQAPVLTKTWFHTGAYFDNEKILDRYRKEYFNNAQVEEHILPATWMTDHKGDLLATTSPAIFREAARACKSMVLHQEVYGLDGTDKEDFPYSTSSHNYHTRLLQPMEENPYASFLITISETITYQYEREPADPAISHDLILKVDQYGHPLQTVAIAYGRRTTDPALPADVTAEQELSHLLLNETRYTNDIDTPTDYRLRSPAETVTCELNGFVSSGRYFTIDELSTQLTSLVPLSFETPFTAGEVQIRTISRVRILFINDTATGPLPLYQSGTKGLTYEKYTFAYTRAFLFDQYADKVTEAMLLRSGYRKTESLQGEGLFPGEDAGDDWWVPSGTALYPAEARQHFFIPDRYLDLFGNTSRVFYEPKYQLHIERTEDALQNGTQLMRFDYRVMAPVEIKDVNDNLSEAVFDTLGMLAGMAVKGKGNEADDLSGFIPDLTETEVEQFFLDPFTNGADLLQHASSRFVYDLRSQPLVSASIIRETNHQVSLQTGIPSTLQFSFEYTNGSGKPMMKKIQAEPGEASFIDQDGSKKDVLADPRWIGNGRVILNNKGNPVKQYEPYFSTTHRYEDDRRLVSIGVTPTYYYDPPGRNIRIDKPNGSFSKIEFGPWQKKVFDANDTVKDSSWYMDRIAGELSGVPEEKKAAEKAALHYDTPGISISDSLGRSFYSISQNAFIDPSTQAVVRENYHSFTRLDINGSPLYVLDARDNKVMEYMYDILGRKVRNRSMDAGEIWYFNNAMDQPVLSGDDRVGFRYEYDVLQRPVKIFVTQAGGVERTSVKTIYGGNTAAEKQLNCCGKTLEQYDEAGIVRNRSFDHHGNVLFTDKQLIKNYKEEINWETVDLLNDVENEVFVSSTEYDALGRVFRLALPDNSIIHMVYGRTGLLQQTGVQVKGGAKQEFVKRIDYNSKLQRTGIRYGNDVVTKCVYDPDTWALRQLITTGDSGASVLQELYYTYDAARNIVQVEDKAQQSGFFNNSVVDPVNQYTYDALYRLIEASGREHIGQQVQPQDNWNDLPRINLQHRQDGSAMRNYTQQYSYDEAGNILQLKHIANGGSFTRAYEYEPTNNRLKSTAVGADVFNYSYDEKGSFLSMPHLQQIDWNDKEEFAHAGMGGGGHAYYVYNFGGDRMRKVIELPGGKRKETIYLGGLEIYRESQNDTIELERETLHVMDTTARIAMIETKTIDMNDATGVNVALVRYQFGNHLGSAGLELDDSGQVISYEEYHPYGTTSYQAVNKSIKAAAKRYRYSGKERDEETGFYYHGARYYVPWLGRWTAADPIGIGDGLNVYAYVGNDPVNKNDPTGNIKGVGKYDTPAPEVKNGEYTGREFMCKSSDMTDCVLDGHDGAYSESWTRPGTPTTEEPKESPKPPKPSPKKPTPKKGPPQEKKGEGLGYDVKVIKTGLYQEVLLGELYEGPPTVLGTVLSIGLSFVPYVDSTMDVRDVAATKDRYDKDPTPENRQSLGMASMGAIPMLGSLISGASKLWKGRKAVKSVMKIWHASEEVLDEFDKLDHFKKALKAGDKTADLTKTTFARLIINGEEVYGNAISTAGRSKKDINMMRDLLKESYGKTAAHATMQHAEADSLLEAYSKGFKAEKAVMYVDRDLCAFCYGSLKNVFPLLGLKELTIYSRHGDDLIRYTIKAAQ